MPDFRDISIGITAYKSFGPDQAVIPSIKPINVVIGRNNAGKSAILDVIDYLCKREQIIERHYHRANQSKIRIAFPAEEKSLSNAFQRNTTGGGIDGNHWDDFGVNLIGKKFTATVTKSGLSYDGIDDEGLGYSKRPELIGYLQAAMNNHSYPFTGVVFKRINAERDISPEPVVEQFQIRSNGQGLTQAFTHILNREDQPSDLIQKDVLFDLNRIFNPDASFISIYVQLIANNTWEIFLMDESGARIPLSNSGSGLKTALQLIANFRVIPYVEQRAISSYIFGLEEIENNLHPALQRRVFSYIDEFVRSSGSTVFLTTHSSCVIDMFSGRADAQLIHVKQEGGVANFSVVNTYYDGKNILDDLDVRASDLLQSNGLVWLEGPSDRIYFNKWIEVWSEGRVREGTHYQCVYYGGKLLSHIGGMDPELTDGELIAALNVNRNAIIIMDSDIKSGLLDEINETKRRIEREFESSGALSWITPGREIENCIPESSLRAVMNGASRPLNAYESIADYLDEIEPGGGGKFRKSKVYFARMVAPTLDRKAIQSVLGLPEFLDAAIEAISGWNGRVP